MTGLIPIVQKSQVMSEVVADYVTLLHRGMFSPCCGCMIDCLPSICDTLAKWLE